MNIHARKSASATQSDRPGLSGAKPRRTPSSSAARTTASTTKSERYALIVVEPNPTRDAGLVGDVQEEDRDRRGEHDRTRRYASVRKPGRQGDGDYTLA